MNILCATRREATYPVYTSIYVDLGGSGGRSPPPRMVLDLSAAGAGGVLYLQYLIISKYVHSKTMIKIKNSQLLNRYLCN